MPTGNRLSHIQDLLQDSFPADQYRLVILSGFLHPTDEIRAAIDQKLRKKGKTLLWCQFTADDLSGTKTTYDPYGEYMRGKFEGICFPEAPVSCPRFQKEALVGAYPLAVYESTNEPSVVAYDGARETNIVSTLPNLPPELLREIATLAGAHLYTRKGDIIYAGGNFVGIHARSAGEKRIQLPVFAKALVDTQTGERPFLFDGIFADFEMEQFETRLFKVEM